MPDSLTNRPVSRQLDVIRCCTLRNKQRQESLADEDSSVEPSCQLDGVLKGIAKYSQASFHPGEVDRIDPVHAADRQSFQESRAPRLGLR
jgi:hypothetical protein